MKTETNVEQLEALRQDVLKAIAALDEAVWEHEREVWRAYRKANNGADMPPGTTGRVMVYLTALTNIKGAFIKLQLPSFEAK